MLELNLLKAEQDGEDFYRTTDKGLEVLHVYYYLKSVIGVKTVDFLLVRMLGRLMTNKKAAGIKGYIV